MFLTQKKIMKQILTIIAASLLHFNTNIGVQINFVALPTPDSSLSLQFPHANSTNIIEFGANISII